MGKSLLKTQYNKLSKWLFFTSAFYIQKYFNKNSLDSFLDACPVISFLNFVNVYCLMKWNSFMGLILSASKIRLTISFWLWADCKHFEDDLKTDNIAFFSMLSQICTYFFEHHVDLLSSLFQHWGIAFVYLVILEKLGCELCNKTGFQVVF